MASSDGDMTKIIDFLLKYPLKPEPVPDWMPDILKFEHYPGQDYVVGFCREAIEEFMESATKAKLKEARELCVGYAELFEKILEKREKDLQKITNT